MHKPDNIQAACEAAQIRILRYEPGEILKVRCEMHWAGKILLSVFSLGFFAFGALIVSSMFEFLGDWIKPACGLSALALWLRFSLRGAWVCFDLRNGGYTFRTVVESETSSALPDFEIKSHKVANHWESVLLCDGQPLGQPRKHQDRRVAEAVFVEFTSLFTSPYLAVKRMMKTARIKKDELVEESAENMSGESSCIPTEPPLILLIHGTFAPNASWTYQESSELVAGIQSAEIEAEFQRFQWTGRNKAKDRRKAAEELAQSIRPILDSGSREVVLIGHSHGGNVALQTAIHLNARQRRCLKFCCLATPFLGTSQRFDAWDYFERLPEFVRDNLYTAIIASIMAITCFLYFAVQDLFLPESLHVAFGTGGGSYSLIPMLAWILLVPWFSNKLIERVVGSTVRNEALQRQDVSNSNNTLVCAYSHDEAYMALSIISNFVALVQFGIFKFFDGVAFFFRKTKIFEILFGWSWLLIWFGVVVSIFAFSVAILATMIIPTSWRSAWSIDFSLLAFEPNDLPIEWLFSLMLIALLIVGLSFITCFCLMLTFGFMRLVIFWIIGVGEQITTRRSLIETFMGSYVVSSVPFGDTRVRFLPGRFQFNHSEIYRDPDCISQVVNFLSE